MNGVPAANTARMTMKLSDLPTTIHLLADDSPRRKLKFAAYLNESLKGWIVPVWPSVEAVRACYLWTGEVPTTTDTLSFVSERAKDRERFFCLFFNPTRDEKERVEGRVWVPPPDRLVPINTTTIWPFVKQELAGKPYPAGYLGFITDLAVQHENLSPLQLLALADSLMQTMREVREVESKFPAPKPCDRCGETQWRVEVSPNERSAKYECEYCGLKVFVKAKSPDSSEPNTV